MKQLDRSIRNSWLGIALAALLFALISPLLAFAGQEKVSVCHLDDEGNYILISIGVPAVDSHLAHGDVAAGSNGLDENCDPLDTDGDGIVDIDDNCVDVYNPDQSDRYGSAKGDACEDDSNGDGTLDVDETDICVSIDGVLIAFRGFVFACNSTPTSGDMSNIAVAHGPFASASAFNGSGNTALADGDSAIAGAGNGDNNTAMAAGFGAIASASDGSNNSAIASGAQSKAFAGPGSNNTAIADGTSAFAQAMAVDGCTAEAIGDNTAAICP